MGEWTGSDLPTTLAFSIVRSLEICRDAAKELL